MRMSVRISAIARTACAAVPKSPTERLSTKVVGLRPKEVTCGSAHIGRRGTQITPCYS